MTKVILRKILGRAALDYEELITVLCDCERVINSRPLTYMSEDLDDVSPLTPEIFLREIPEFGVPDIDTVDREKLSKRAKYLQKMLQQLRSKFRIEYPGQLRQQSVKNYKDKSLSKGEILLLEVNSKKGAY
ncbi:integrase catalytic domain-containing protein [Trichonephila clavipes]|nr:integrase catalytic domain-containing protein [Trichonephila clavipes]